MWFCRHLIRTSIEFHLFTRFRYSFNENVFYIYFRHDVQLVFFDFCNWINVRNNEKINNVSTLQTDVQIQKTSSQTQTRTTCKKVCHQFVFSISCAQINMQNKKKINNQKCDDFVRFAKIANFCSEISENRCSKVFNNQFVFFNYYDQFNVQNRKKVNNHFNYKSFKTYFWTKSRMTISYCLFVYKIENISFEFFVEYVRNYIKKNEERIDSKNYMCSNKMQTMQTKFWFQ